MEAGVRALNMHEPLIWAPDAKFGWKPIACAKRLYTDEGHGLVEISSHGYRDRERQTTKNTDTVRVGVFGDSQTEAIQVHLEETYHYQLQEMFTNNKQNIEVLNFGVTGYSPTQVLLTIQQEMEKYDLDVIVVSLFLDNDVSGSIAELSVSTTGTPFIVPGKNPIEFDYTQAVESHQSFFQEPKYSIRKHSGLYRFIFKIKNSLTQCGENCQVKPIPTRYELYLDNPDEIWNKAWSVFDQTLVEIKRLVESHNRPLLFLSIPAGQTVSPAAWENIVEQHPDMADQIWNLAAAEQRLASFCQQHSIPLIQPYQSFKEKAATTKLHFGNVGHLTAEGHTEIARAIYPQLTRTLSGL